MNGPFEPWRSVTFRSSTRKRSRPAAATDDEDGTTRDAGLGSGREPECERSVQSSDAVALEGNVACWLLEQSIRRDGIAAVSPLWPAAGRRAPRADEAAFRADATLVLVPVTVVDRRGAIVNGLASDAFTLTEDGVQQPIRSFSEEDAPVSMGIVLDLSGSMKGVLGAAKESLRALMKDANPGDEAFLNGVSTRPRAYSGFTEDFDEIMRRVESEGAGGYTALIDTIYGSLQRVALRRPSPESAGGHFRRNGQSQPLHQRRAAATARWNPTHRSTPSPSAARRRPHPKPIALTEEKRGLLFSMNSPQRPAG